MSCMAVYRVMLAWRRLYHESAATVMWTCPTCDNCEHLDRLVTEATYSLYPTQGSNFVHLGVRNQWFGT